MAKVLVDTNLLVYAATEMEGTKHEKAKTALSELMRHQEFCVSAQNLAEFCRVMGEKVKPIHSPTEIAAWVRAYRRSGEVLHYTSGSVLSALKISQNDGLHFFDALLVATMRENGVDEIWTEDEKDFGKVRGLKCKNPLK
jgi:predicted nucleic acid-binding protein